MADEVQDKFAYNGPKGGGTSGYDDLHENGSNPFSNDGTPPIDAAASSAYPNTGPAGYYSPPAVGNTDNPRSGSSAVLMGGDGSLTSYVSSGLNNKYAEALNMLDSGDASMSSAGAAAIYDDSDSGKTGNDNL